jgi:hypothetical protein
MDLDNMIVRWILVRPYDLPTLRFRCGQCNKANTFPTAKTGLVTPPCFKVTYSNNRVSRLRNIQQR